MRKLTSLLLAVSGCFLLITSVVMYIIPTGRVAYWADYQLLWLTKGQWGDLHISFGVMVVACGLLHLLFNLKFLLDYLRNRARRVSFLNPNFITALILTAYVGVGTIFSLPPMNLILEYSEQFKENAEIEYGVPPYGHAELSSLKKFCKKMDLNSQEALAGLRHAGIMVADENDVLKDIAALNKRTPQEIYELILIGQSRVERKKVPHPLKQEQGHDPVLEDLEVKEEGAAVKESLGDSTPLPTEHQQEHQVLADHKVMEDAESAEKELVTDSTPLSTDSTQPVTDGDHVVADTTAHEVVVKPQGLGKKTLTALSQERGLTVEEALHILEEKGIVAEPLQTIKEIAGANDSTPMFIGELLVKE